MHGVLADDRQLRDRAPRLVQRPRPLQRADHRADRSVYPEDALPAPLGDLGLLLPLTWALPALRDALGQGETDVATALLGEFAVAIAYLIVGLFLFRIVEWRARTNGTYDTV